MSVRYRAEDTGAVFALLGPYSPSVVEDENASESQETSFEAPPEEAERLAAALFEATRGRIEGLWRASADDDFPFPEFVSGAAGSGGS